MKHNKVLIWLLLPVGLLIYNVVNAIFSGNVAGYFVTPLYAILNIGIAIYFAYYLNQKNNKDVKQKQQLETFLNKMLSEFDSNLDGITNLDEIRKIRVSYRVFRNRVNTLERMCGSMLETDDISYIKEKLECYWDTISENITDIEALKRENTNIQNIVANITNRVEEMVFKLYN